MQTLSNSPATIIPYENREALVIGFISSADLAIGTPVKLNNDGSVSAITAVTDLVLGVVVSGWKGNDPGTVRVQTPFIMILRGKADGTVDEGDRVSCSGFDSGSGLGKYKKSVSTNWVIGQAMIGGASVTVAETLATATYTITTAGSAGDRHTISTGGDVLGSYVVITADTATLVAAGLKAAINAATAIHGFTADNTGAVLTVTGPTGSGDSLNAQLLVRTVTGTAAGTVAAFSGGIDEVTTGNSEGMRIGIYYTPVLMA